MTINILQVLMGFCEIKRSDLQLSMMTNDFIHLGQLSLLSVLQGDLINNDIDGDGGLIAALMLFKLDHIRGTIRVHL